MNLFFEFLFGLSIFIVGSLILTFFFYPDSFDSLKNNINSIIIKNVNNINEDNRVNYFVIEDNSPCSYLEIMAKVEDKSENFFEQSGCEFICANREKLEFAYHECINDKLICYCKK